MTTHANPCGAARTWVVWASTWHVTCFGFLVYLKIFFALFFGSRRTSTSGQILTIYALYDVFPRKEMHLGVFVHTALHFGNQMPKKLFWAWIGILSVTRKILKLAYYRNHCIDFNQICTATTTTKYSSWVVQTGRQQIQDGGRPPSWKIKIWPYLLYGMTDRRELARWRTLALRSGCSVL